MQYSPKLKKAAKEIQSIIDKYDIAAIVVLHTPGHSEYLMKIDPSYSCAKIMPGGAGLRVTTKGLPRSKKERVAADTSNMMHLLAETTGMLAMNIIEASKVVDRVTGSDHFGPGHTSREQQDN